MEATTLSPTVRALQVLAGTGLCFDEDKFCTNRWEENCRAALYDSNRILKDFKYGAGRGVRVPSASSGHSYQHIQKKKKRK